MKVSTHLRRPSSELDLVLSPAHIQNFRSERTGDSSGDPMLIPRVDGSGYEGRGAPAFASVRSAGPHRVMKYDTIGEVRHCGDIMSIED